jgi:A/G-specific adenine glycosylase
MSRTLPKPASSTRVHRPSAGSAPALLHRRLLAWYDRHGRDLPWRRTRDPYPVWLSEVMLQQTRVATAEPYYHAFLERFPTLAALARARPARVLAAWAGLGYYRRARHFHDAARTVVREHHGRVPDDPEAFRRLPGVGRYTTGAVLSICFDRPLAVLDGNVARVLSRFFALPGSIREPRAAARLWALADSLVPMRRPGDWNQAMMELGATICVPLAPRCGECPIRTRCRALALGRVAEFPAVAARRAPEAVRRAVALIGHRGRVLMERRTGALLAGLWEPPGVSLAKGANAGPALAAALRGLGIPIRSAALAPTGRTVRHTITHRAIVVEVWGGVFSGRPVPGAGVRWVSPKDRSLPLTALARKLIETPPPPKEGARRARR